MFFLATCRWPKTDLNKWCTPRLKQRYITRRTSLGTSGGELCLFCSKPTGTSLAMSSLHEFLSDRSPNCRNRLSCGKSKILPSGGCSGMGGFFDMSSNWLEFKWGYFLYIYIYNSYKWPKNPWDN